MTTFSVYASRFLLSGLGGGGGPSAQSTHSDATDPLFRSHFDLDGGNPLEDSDEGPYAYDRRENAASTTSDGLPEQQAHARPAHSLLGASRLATRAAGRTAAPAHLAESIREIDDEDDVDLWRHDRRGGGLPSNADLFDSATSDRAAAAGPSSTRDSHAPDPFLAEDDLQRRDAPSPSPKSKRSRDKAVARGWLAHGEASSIDVETAGQQSLQESESPEDDARTGRRPSRAPLRYSLYDDDDEQGEGETSTLAGGRSRSRRRSGSTSSSASSSSDLSSTSSQDFEAQRRSGLRAQDVYKPPLLPAQYDGWFAWTLGNGRVEAPQQGWLAQTWKESNDSVGLVFFAFALTATVVIGGGMGIWGTHSPSSPPTPSTRPSSYYTITRSVPLLLILTLLSLGAGCGSFILMRSLPVGRVGGARLLRGVLVAIPFTLGIGWLWAFAGSFIYADEGWSGGEWSTTGLRILSLLPLVLAILFTRTIWAQRAALSRSLSVLELSVRIVSSHPTLLLLSLAQLGVFLALTLPFLTIFARLFLRGHFGDATAGSDTRTWHTDTQARYLAYATLGTWLWSWAVVRGVQRVTVAGVVAHWYFEREALGVEGGGGVDDSVEPGEDSLPGPSAGAWSGGATSATTPRKPRTSADVVRASFLRATGPALGTVCVSALILTLAQLCGLIAALARRIARLTAAPGTPTFLHPLGSAAAVLAGVGALAHGCSEYALTYVGVTGERWGVAAKRAGRVVGRYGAKGLMDGLIIHLLLRLSTLSLALIAGLAGFLFSAHQLHVPADAPLVGLLCALVPYWTLRLCADVLANAADTLYLCHGLDARDSHADADADRSASASASASVHRTQTKEAFEGAQELPR